MSYTDKNKIEQLEQKIAQLERKLEQMSSKEEIIRDMENRLGVYDDTIRSDNGELILKKNFVINSRKGKIVGSRNPGVDPKTDNVVTFSFNDRQSGRLNHIFLGDASAEAGFRNSVLSGTAVVAEDVDKRITNNGKIQFSLYREDKIGPDGIPIATAFPNISVFTRESETKDLSKPGDNVRLIASREYGEVSLFYVGDDFNYHRLSVGKDGVRVGSGNVVEDGGMGPTSPIDPLAGINLSDITINEDKNWNDKSITNINNITATGNVNVGGNSTVTGTVAAANVTISDDLLVGGNVLLQNLPTSDPGTAGLLWRDGTTLKVSLG